ncbi:MAG: hypothetical protein ACOH18_02140 [Candidatus Saccharimonadaceae bacterium]
MEQRGNSEGTPKPELDRHKRDELFKYAQDRQRWIRARVESAEVPVAIDGLVEELEYFVADNFDSKPQVVAVSWDIQHTGDIVTEGSRHIIQTEPLPLRGDEAVLQEYTVQGSLYGFHQGEERNDLRVYVSSGKPDYQYIGGVIIPLLSISIENSHIQFAESIAEQKLIDIGAKITEQLAKHSQEIRGFVTDLVRQLDDRKSSKEVKLKNSSTTIAGIARSKEVSLVFVDYLVEYIKLKLYLDMPHDIHTNAYQVIISKQPTISYKTISNPEFFPAIIPELGLIGETDNKGLGLIFLIEDIPLQIPVQYITTLNQAE